MRKFWQGLRELPILFYFLRNLLCGSEAERNEDKDEALL
jgi:hypothetical protein